VLRQTACCSRDGWSARADSSIPRQHAAKHSLPPEVARHGL